MTPNIFLGGVMGRGRPNQVLKLPANFTPTHSILASIAAFRCYHLQGVVRMTPTLHQHDPHYTYEYHHITATQNPRP